MNKKSSWYHGLDSSGVVSAALHDLGLKPSPVNPDEDPFSPRAGDLAYYGPQGKRRSLVLAITSKWRQTHVERETVLQVLLRRSLINPSGTPLEMLAIESAAQKLDPDARADVPLAWRLLWHLVPRTTRERWVRLCRGREDEIQKSQP